MTTSTQWQLARSAAQRYQTILTPAILGPFARALVDFAALQTGESVVDVGCGTGAAARYAATRVGADGAVLGVDVNASMIDVARSLPVRAGTAVSWRVGDAARLPLADDSVDVALCAQTLQFLPQKAASLMEMKRVVRPGGRVALSLWCPLAENPYFAALVAAVATHIGADTAAGLLSAFSLTDADAMRRLLRAAGLADIRLEVIRLDLPLPDLSTFVPRHISATPMAGGFNQAASGVQQAIVTAVQAQVGLHASDSRGPVPFRSYLISGRR